jgi:hypothetical protein
MVRASDEPQVYTAGQIAPPGRYVRVDRPSAVEIILEEPGILPASLDGHVAVYERVSMIGPRAAPRRSA